MKGLFSKIRNRFIGIDLGTSAIKVVEISHRENGAHLENYGWFDLAGLTDHSSSAPSLTYEEKYKMAIVNLFKKTGIKGKYVNVAIPGFKGLVILVEFPNMNESEVEKAIEFEASKYIPVSAEEVSISWEILKNTDNASAKEKVLQVLLVAAPKNEINRIESTFKETGFEIDSIELETFAIARSIVGKKPGVSLIIDIGSNVSNIVLVRDGVVLMNRTIDVGGNDVTTTIAEGLNISRQRAESFKREDKDLLNETETAMVMPSIELLGGEARRMIMSFRDKNKTAQVDRILLSGGGANLCGIERYFSNMLGIDVIKANPLENISYDPKLAPLLEKIGSSFSVAIGLGMRGMEENNAS